MRAAEVPRLANRVYTDPPAGPPVFEAAVAARTVTVVLGGEFDITTESFLADRLEEVRRIAPCRLTFKATQVAFMDCASARLIAGTARWLPAGSKPVISWPSPIVRRVLQVSGIGRLCELEP